MQDLLEEDREGASGHVRERIRRRRSAPKGTDRVRSSSFSRRSSLGPSLRLSLYLDDSQGPPPLVRFLPDLLVVQQTRGGSSRRSLEEEALLRRADSLEFSQCRAAVVRRTQRKRVLRGNDRGSSRPDWKARRDHQRERTRLCGNRGSGRRPHDRDFPRLLLPKHQPKRTLQRREALRALLRGDRGEAARGREEAPRAERTRREPDRSYGFCDRR